MHAFDGNLARFGPASDCIARNRDTNDVSLEMGRELTPVLIAAKKFGPMNTNGQNPKTVLLPLLSDGGGAYILVDGLATRSPNCRCSL